MNSCRLMIIDGNSILNRAFYGLQGRYLLQTTDGLYTNAVYGFLNILFKYMEEEKPEYICVAFDLKAPTFRHIEYDMYKADRKGMPEELAVQVPVIKEVLDAMSIERMEKEGFEADDIIGSVSLYAEEKGFETVIITGDRDALQLASQNTRIKIPSTKSGKTETNEYNYDAVKRKYEVSPIQLIDVKGLMGDKSDNIPGVTGIGEKTALNLIKEFNSIEELYENIERRLHIHNLSPGKYTGLEENPYANKRMWESLDNYLDEYDHPIWKKFHEDNIYESGHAGADFVIMRRLINLFNIGAYPDIDVYDLAAWSCLVELTEISARNGSKPVEIPDFTRGKWKTREPLPIVL